MKNPFLFLAGLFGTTGVALGALGAHALKEKLKAGIIDSFQYDAFDKGTKYQLFHAIVLLFIFFLYRSYPTKLVKISGWLFTIGILFFSVSIYFLSTQPITKMNFSWMGPITPVGGILLMSGWVCIVIQALKLPKD
ncbi:MAG TPA: DUF423 domain-containing protein [Bacteroidia bacterium]|jgi:uncharacterized membrane protein YgdD (TMEM256/DUF423 family)|nr:DUF423 domain-containing protein [Bacteroidia bacterium]